VAVVSALAAYFSSVASFLQDLYTALYSIKALRYYINFLLDVWRGTRCPGTWREWRSGEAKQGREARRWPSQAAVNQRKDKSCCRELAVKNPNTWRIKRGHLLYCGKVAIVGYSFIEGWGQIWWSAYHS